MVSGLGFSVFFYGFYLTVLGLRSRVYSSRV